MKDFQCLLVRNERLAFRDAQTVVEAFLLRRLACGGCTKVRIVAPEELDDALAQARAEEQAYIVVASVMHPLLDLELVRAMATRLDLTGASVCQCDGAVPGTQPMLVARAGPDCAGEHKMLRWHTQRRYNNQFNLFKYKRLKMFLALETMLPEMAALNIDDVVQVLDRHDIFQALAGYCTGARLVEQTTCPYCDGALHALPRGMSQPFCGFIPASRPLYSECQGCGLIVATPTVHEDDISKIYDAFDTQDFLVTHNTPYKADTPRCDLSSILADLPETPRTLDLGGGIGRFSLMLKNLYPSWRVTHSDFDPKHPLERDLPGVETRVIDLLHDEIGHQDYDLITAWEVVEHLPFRSFRELLDRVWRALAPGGFFLCSTPDFDSPLCRAFDFFAACPPFHQLVFRASWLQRFFAQDPRWEYLPPRACSDFLDDAAGWYGYAMQSCPSLQERATAQVLGLLFQTHGQAATRTLLAQGVGTEIILTLRKR